ncbi:MAG TPA: ricin-type beta-trefoil lectin domain protein [Pseudonocardiaceae bacterium]|nr:ricin-type beta-trefoil lectin domain protein [Pseudonocardiaceae bacterium]
MMRAVRLAFVAAMVLAGTLAAPMANAAPEVVRIADAELRSFATAALDTRLVTMRPRVDSDLQKWTIDRDSATVGTRVVNNGTRGCMTVPTTTPIVEGTLVIQVDCVGHTHELWRFRPDTTTNTVHIVHVRSQLCATIELASPSLYPRLRLYTCANTARQQFVLLTG